MIQSLGDQGKLILVHAFGNDPGVEIIHKIWPDENPFSSLATDIIVELKKNVQHIM